jgi:hypothetical protein
MEEGTVEETWVALSICGTMENFILIRTLTYFLYRGLLI